MATIDLIVLGMLKKEPMGAYDIQKLVEYRNISKWVKISTPSILIYYDIPLIFEYHRHHPFTKKQFSWKKKASLKEKL